MKMKVNWLYLSITNYLYIKISEWSINFQKEIQKINHTNNLIMMYKLLSIENYWSVSRFIGHKSTPHPTTHSQ